jgi:luciferase-type oxidoreductase
LATPNGQEAHTQFAASDVFAQGALSIGLTLPILRAGTIVADFNEQLALAQLADERGFRALWVRDVPLNSADYPDPVGHLDPWVFLGALATRTTRTALGSGAIVLTLRHPLHIAKAAQSVSLLSGGRFMLGLGSGDRPPEYAAFGAQSDERRELYRRHWETLAAALGKPPRVIPDHAPEGAPAFQLLPESAHTVPLLAVGFGRSECRLDRAACARMDHVSPRARSAARAIQHVARGCGACGARRIPRFRRRDAARTERRSARTGAARDARLPLRPPRVDRYSRRDARGRHASRDVQSRGGPPRRRGDRRTGGRRVAAISFALIPRRRYVEIFSSSSPFVRGPSKPIASITISIAPAMNTNTPAVPKCFSTAAIMKAVKIAEKRLHE